MVNYAAGVDVVHMLSVLEKLCVLVDDQIERDLLHISYLSNRIDCAHYQLVKVAVDEEFGLAAEDGFHDTPDDLLHLFG